MQQIQCNLRVWSECDKYHFWKWELKCQNVQNYSPKHLNVANRCTYHRTFTSFRSKQIAKRGRNHAKWKPKHQNAANAMENHKFFTQKPCDKPAKHHTNHTMHETQKKSKTVKTNTKNNSAPISRILPELRAIGIRHRNLKCQMIQPTCGTDGQSTCCRASRCNVAFWHFRSTQAHQAESNCLWPWRCSSRATIRQSGTSFTKPRNTASPASSSFPSNAEATDGPLRFFPPQMSRVSLYMPTGEWASMRSTQRCTAYAFASKIRAQNPKNWYNECWSSRAWSRCCLHARSLAWGFWFRAPDLTSCSWSRCCSCCSSVASPSFALSLLFIPSLSSSIRSLSYIASH